MVTCLLIYFCCLWLSTVGMSLLPPLSSSSPCRAVLLRWLQGKLSLVPSWGQTHRAVSGTRTRLQLLTPHWRQVLAASPHPGMGHTEHFGSCTERPELPTSPPWPGDSGLCHSRPEQGSAGDSCSPGGRACSGCLSPLSVPRAGAGGAVLIPHPQHWPGLESLCRWGEEHPAAPWETKAMFTSDSSGPAGTE